MGYVRVLISEQCNKWTSQTLPTTSYGRSDLLKRAGAFNHYSANIIEAWNTKALIQNFQIILYTC